MQTAVQKPASAPDDLATQLAASLLLHERLRQIEKEGYTSEHDDHHIGGELAFAAAAYAYAGGCEDGARLVPSVFWPWNLDDWKSRSKRVCLIKAGALILAELERLARLEAAQVMRAVSHGKQEAAQ